MDKKSLAAVIVDKRRMEMREFAVPDPGADDAVLKVEACGICGSDYHYYKELDHWPYLKPPHIMGHEVVGRIGAIGRDASRQWKLKEGRSGRGRSASDLPALPLLSYRQRDAVRRQAQLRHQRQHGRSAAPMGRLRAIHVSSPKFDSPPGARRSDAPGGGALHLRVERFEMGAARAGVESRRLHRHSRPRPARARLCAGRSDGRRGDHRCRRTGSGCGSGSPWPKSWARHT